MTKRLLLPRSQAVGLDGRPLAGAKLYTYASGTSTPKAVFTDAGLSVPHANPVIADAAGRFPAMFLAVGLYRTVLTDAADVTIATDDPVEGQVEPTATAWGNTVAATITSIGFINSENIAITGNATIASFGVAPDGARRQLRFANTPTLVNSANLVLPFGANILALPGDTAIAVSLGSDNWVVTQYQYAARSAAREAIGAAPLPQTASGVGQWSGITTDASGNHTLPAGGTWVYFWSASLGLVGFAAGGTQIVTGDTPNVTKGFAWRLT